MASSGPTVILMAGLQGSGKTTACAKLAQFFGKQGKDVALAACDVYRPAAVEQLATMGKRAGAHVYERGTEADPVDIATWALDEARAERRDVLIVDTAGRLHIDQDLMAELAKIRKETKPHDVLLVVDAMTGQDAVGVAESFAEVAEFDGVVMTKLDGDARGGAALSVKAVTGKPILFASTGEKIEDFDKFHPDRMSQRILGMGDVLSLIEKAEQQVDEKEAEELQEKMRRDQFGLDDFLKQMKQVRKMGPLSGIIGMLPGMGAMKQLKNAPIDETRARPGRGDHPLDDAQGAGQPGPDQRLPPQTDRQRLRHQGAERQPAGQAVRPDESADEIDGQRAGADPAADGQAGWRWAARAAPEGAKTLICPALWQSESDLDAWVRRRTRSGASSSPTNAPRVTVGRSRRSASTTRRPSPRRSTSTRSALATGSSTAPSRRRRSRLCCGPRASRLPAASRFARMTELLEFLVKALVEEPEAVVVEELEEDGDLVYEISVAEGDLGRVIGKGGRIANAIRTIAKAAAVRIDRRVIVDILD